MRVPCSAGRVYRGAFYRVASEETHKYVTYN